MWLINFSFIVAMTAVAILRGDKYTEMYVMKTRKRFHYHRSHETLNVLSKIHTSLKVNRNLSWMYQNNGTFGISELDSDSKLKMDLAESKLLEFFLMFRRNDWNISFCIEYQNMVERQREICGIKLFQSFPILNEITWYKWSNKILNIRHTQFVSSISILRSNLHNYVDTQKKIEATAYELIDYWIQTWNISSIIFSQYILYSWIIYECDQQKFAVSNFRENIWRASHSNTANISYIWRSRTSYICFDSKWVINEGCTWIVFYYKVFFAFIWIHRE